MKRRVKAATTMAEHAGTCFHCLLLLPVGHADEITGHSNPFFFFLNSCCLQNFRENENNMMDSFYDTVTLEKQASGASHENWKKAST